MSAPPPTVEESIATIRAVRYEIYAKGNFGVLRVSCRWGDTAFPGGDDLSIEKTTVQGELRNMGAYQRIRERWLLPESFTIIGIYIEFLRRSWAVVLQSHDIAPSPEGEYLPFCNPVYSGSRAQGTLRFVRMAYSDTFDYRFMLRVD